MKSRSPHPAAPAGTWIGANGDGALTSEIPVDRRTPAQRGAEKVCYIIVKAREFDAKVEIDDPEPASNPSDDKGIDVLEDLPDDPTLEELTGAIQALNDDETLDLVALNWGRGDYTQEWRRAAGSGIR
jgi:hypothetical protein